MRFTSAIFICFITIHQPVMAVVDATADEDDIPVPDSNRHQQPVADTPDTKAKASPEVTHGRMLYENHCTSCHESMVYIRAKRKAKSYQEIVDWVNQRADWLNLGWSNLEKREVIQYLNERYYNYSLPD